MKDKIEISANSEKNSKDALSYSINYSAMI